MVGRLVHAADITKGWRWEKGVESTLHETRNTTDQIALWEFAGVLGALVEGPGKVHVHLRYITGFTNLDLATGSSPSYTNGVQVGVVYCLAGERHVPNEPRP